MKPNGVNWDAQPLVRCDAVARTYGSGRIATVALHDTTCSVLPGDQIALTGPSGSGKTTLLHLMAGLDEPTGGTISWPAIGGRNELRPGPLAMVFQGPSLLPPLSVLENVALPLQLLGWPVDHAFTLARDALGRLDIVELADKLPEEISGGQSQRVAVARVLAARPRLILADEPTGQLDHESGSLTVDVLIDTAEQTGAALVLSTHDPAVADRFPKRWEIADGRLTQPESTACSV